MRINILLIFFLFLAGITHAQKTKKITIKTEYPPSKETYFVLKSNKSIKHGAYKKEMRGKVIKKGQFSNDIRTGVWEYYDSSGELAHKLDVERKIILYDKFSDQNSQFETEKYTRPLIILGGLNSVFQQIAYNLRYPVNARRNGTQGKIMIKMIINAHGQPDVVEVLEGLGDELDEEAVRVIKLLDFEALPALDLDGNPIESEIILPITFKLG